MTVDGTYWFLCRPFKEARIGLFFPYPTDSLLGEARTLSLVGRGTGGQWEPMEFTEDPGHHGASWRLPLDLGDTVEVRTIYRQALKASYARYIVTTTNTWDRPLRRARFEIHLPEGARPVEFSYPFKSQKSVGRVWYVFEVSAFRPDRDIIVRWRPSPGS